MKRTKTIYQWTTLVALTIIVNLFAVLIDWDLKWYHFMILFFIGTTLGKFLFVLIQGVSISKVVIIDSAEDGITEFVGDIQLGFSRQYRINGRIADQWGLSEEEITQMIYNQTPKQFFKSLITTGQTQNFHYESYSKQVEIEFSI
jgi:hypothetical protein